MNPMESVVQKKEKGERMTCIEKILYTRIIFGLGLKEALEKVRGEGNFFDGAWSGS